MRICSEAILAVLLLEVLDGQANAWRRSRFAEGLDSRAAVERFPEASFIARILYHAPFKVVVGILGAQVLYVLLVFHGDMARRGGEAWVARVVGN